MLLIRLMTEDNRGRIFLVSTGYNSSDTIFYLSSSIIFLVRYSFFIYVTFYVAMYYITVFCYQNTAHNQNPGQLTQYPSILLFICLLVQLLSSIENCTKVLKKFPKHIW